MAKIALPYTIINGDPVDAGPVEANYQTIETYSNQELIERGGTVAMTAQLKLVGNPVAALDAAPKQYVDTMIPIGGILLFAGSASPVGGTWLLCDGTEYQQATYPELAAVIGAANGRFNVPALIDRFPVGGGSAYAHKSTGGRTDAVVPLHAHSIDHTHGNTGSTDINHFHDIGGMTGAADRPLWTSNDGNHSHHATSDPSVNVLGAHAGGVSLAGGAGGPDIDYYADTTTNGAHSHTVTDHLHSLPGNTAYMKQNNVHAHTVPTFNGGSANAGLDPAGQNLPPYFALAFIIRAR